MVIALLLKTRYNMGECVFECWRTEHGDIALRVSDSGDKMQADFDLSDSEVDELIGYLQRAQGQRAGQVLEGKQ